MTAFLISTDEATLVGIVDDAQRSVQPVRRFELEDGKTCYSLYRVPRDVDVIRVPRNAVIYVGSIAPRYITSRSFHATGIVQLRADRFGIVELPHDHIIATPDDLWFVDVKLTPGVVTNLRHLEGVVDYVLEHGAHHQSIVHDSRRKIDFHVMFARGLYKYWTIRKQKHLLYEGEYNPGDFEHAQRSPNYGMPAPVSGLFEHPNHGVTLSNRFHPLPNLETFRRLMTEGLASPGTLTITYGSEVLLALMSALYGSNKLGVEREVILVHDVGSNYEISY